MSVYNTACPRNCYSTCSMKVSVRNGRLKMIEPHPDNLATPEGVCLKGLSYIERVYSPDRILYPLLRKKNSDKFEQISWSTVFPLLSSKLIHMHETYGPQSILYYTGSGTKGLLNSVGLNFWRMFGGCTTTYGDLCWPAGLEATRLTLGENKHSLPWDIARSKLIIIWGKNPAETNIHQMLFIEQAIQQGAKLVVIDPRRTESSRLAHLHLQPRPGSDGALALAVANLLIDRNQIDHDFIRENLHGFQEFKSGINSMTVDKAAKITDVPEKLISNLANLIAENHPLSINAGFGMQRYSNSGQTIRSIIALLAITGNIGKPGAGWIYANLQSSIFDTVKDPLAFYPPEKPDGKMRVSISTTLLGQDILSSENPAIKMIWVERGNPVTQNPDTNNVLKAFRSLEFRVVVEQFMTDTAREADLILPAKTMFEQSDVIGAYWHPYIQLKQKMIEPPGEVKPESEIYYFLAQALGHDEKEMMGKIPGPSDRQIEDFLNETLKPFPELTLERLKNGPVIAPDNQEVAFSDLIFTTPSGKIELLSAEAEERWDVSPIAEYSEPEESILKENDQNTSFPLYFMTPNTKNRIHSQFNNLNLIKQFSPKPLLYMHPYDAHKRKINPDDRVRIFNNRGELFAHISIDFGLKPGCVAMTNGWWINEGGTVNFLSRGRETDMGYGAAFHENLVEVERVD